MVNVIVIALGQDEIAALPTCANSLHSLGVKRLWILHSPALNVRNEAVLQEFQNRIKLLEQSKEAAKQRDDLRAAADFKDQIEAVQLEQKLSIKKGWEAVPEPERNKQYDQALAPILSGFEAIKMDVLREHNTPEGFLGIVPSLLAIWPPEIPFDQYSIVWPRNCTEPKQSAVSKQEASTATPAPAKPEVVKVKLPSKPQPDLPPKEARRKQLFSQYMTMKAVAKQHNISMEGVPKEQVIQAILDVEFPEAA